MELSPVAVFVDLAFLAIIALYAVYGWHNGLRRGRATLLGGTLGVVVAYFVTAAFAPLSPNIVVTSIAATLTCVLAVTGGHLVGQSLGRLGSRHAENSAGAQAEPRGAPVAASRASARLDRAIGSAGFALVGVLLSAMVVLASSHVGISVASQSLAIRLTHVIVPSVISDSYSAMRNTSRQGNLVRLTATETTTPDAASASPLGHDAANGLAPAIVRISGTAWQCGQGLWGTGIVIAPERVLTNAHVVAGTNEVIVESRGGPFVKGDIVYFDPRHDLAIIAVAGLTAPPITFNDSHVLDDGAVIAGFPHGGSFATSSAIVTDRRAAETTDIYGHGRVRIDYWTIHGTVLPGSSGSPLITSKGEVAGIVFAGAEESETTGFALTLDLVEPLVQRAAGYIIKVEPGPCIAR